MLNRKPPQHVEPTPGEAKNGWTPESLGRYLAERKGAHREPDRRAVVRVESSDDFDPHGW